MKTFLAILFLSAAVSYLVTPLAVRLAFLVGAVDLPGERKVHRKAMPRLGGLAIMLGFSVPWTIFYLIQNRISEIFLNYERLFAALMIAALMMFTLGFYDDVRGASAPKKFAVQFIAALMLYLNGFRITTISNPFGGVFELGLWSLPVSVLWIVGVTNAINLLDGLDGLVTGVTACMALALAVINIHTGNIIVALLTLCLAGACIGFLPHNFSPAKTFMGDCGSLFIGMMLACIGILSLFKAVTVAFFAVPLLLFGVPLYDTFSVMIGRAIRGKSLFKADKTHIHHRLLQLGWTQRQVVGFLYAVSVVLAILAVDFTINHSNYRLFFGLSAVAAVLVKIVFMWRARHPAKASPNDLR